MPKLLVTVAVSKSEKLGQAGLYIQTGRVVYRTDRVVMQLKMCLPFSLSIYLIIFPVREGFNTKKTFFLWNFP